MFLFLHTVFVLSIRRFKKKKKKNSLSQHTVPTIKKHYSMTKIVSKTTSTVNFFFLIA